MKFWLDIKCSANRFLTINYFDSFMKYYKIVNSVKVFLQTYLLHIYVHFLHCYKGNNYVSFVIISFKLHAAIKSPKCQELRCRIVNSLPVARTITSNLCNEYLYLFFGSYKFLKSWWPSINFIFKPIDERQK